MTTSHTKGKYRVLVTRTECLESGYYYIFILFSLPLIIETTNEQSTMEITNIELARCLLPDIAWQTEIDLSCPSLHA